MPSLLIAHKAELVGQTMFKKPWSKLTNGQKEDVATWLMEFNAAPKTPADAFSASERESEVITSKDVGVLKL